jgi:glycogen synthase
MKRETSKRKRKIFLIVTLRGKEKEVNIYEIKISFVNTSKSFDRESVFGKYVSDERRIMCFSLKLLR